MHLELSHGVLGDLEVWLRSPRKTQALIQGRTLGRQTHLDRTYTLADTPSLRQFWHQPCQGTWELIIQDCAPHYTGVLQAWDLILG